MHLHREKCLYVIKGKPLQDVCRWTEDLSFRNKCTNGFVCPRPGTKCMYFTIIFKDLLH